MIGGGESRHDRQTGSPFLLRSVTLTSFTLTYLLPPLRQSCSVTKNY